MASGTKYISIVFSVVFASVAYRFWPWSMYLWIKQPAMIELDSVKCMYAVNECMHVITVDNGRVCVCLCASKLIAGNEAK